MTWTSYAAESKGQSKTSGINPEGATMRVYTPKSGQPQLVIRIGLGALAKAKLDIGTTVDLLTDETKTKVLIKKSDKGWKLARSGERAAELFITWGDKRAFDLSAKKSITLTPQYAEGGIILDIPKE